MIAPVCPLVHPRARLGRGDPAQCVADKRAIGGIGEGGGRYPVALVINFSHGMTRRAEADDCRPIEERPARHLGVGRPAGDSMVQRDDALALVQQRANTFHEFGRRRDRLGPRLDRR